MSNKIKTPYYRHFVVKLACKSDLTNSIKKLEEKTSSFLESLDLVVLKEVHFRFERQGMTLLFVLSSSHMAVHSWPEFDFLHIDLIVCNEEVGLQKVKSSVKTVFEDSRFEVRELTY